MIKMNIELEDIYKDEIKQVIKLTQPKKGHSNSNLLKCLDLYFRKKYIVYLEKDNNIYPSSNLWFSNDLSYIKVEDNKIFFSTIINYLIDIKIIEKIEIDVKSKIKNNMTHRKIYYKVFESNF